MNELSLIQEALKRTAARRRLEHALGGLWLGLLIGSGVWLTLIILYKLAPIVPEAAEWGWILTVAGAVLGFVIGGWRRIPLPAAARLLEQRQSLKERLSTALEVSQRPDSAEWSSLLVSDAANSIRGVNPAQLLPFGLPSFARWIPLLLVIVVGLGFVPEYRSDRYLRAQRDAALVRDAGRKMADLVRHEMEHREPANDSVRDALDSAAALGDRLSQVKLTKAEAVQDLANAAKRLEEEARELDRDPLLRKLQQAARTPSGGNQPGDSALQKQLEKLRQGSGESTPDALEKLAEKLQKAQKMAAAAQGAAPESAAQKALSEALQQLAQSAKDMGLNLSSLDDAMESFKGLNIDRVLRDLKLAGDDLEKLQDMAKKLSEMQQSMAELGKNLAEQLERGQAEAAAQTLERMVEQMRTADLTPEQIKRLMEEVSEAIKPAQEYGKVAELLKKAGEKMAASDKSEASRDLAQAAQELRRLGQQAEDLQQLAATLQALEGAQLALLNGKMWQPSQCKGGTCQGCALCKGGAKGWNHGGKPGGGVGTWADENGWLYYEQERTARWDNTGINRPDMDPRGHTDRGDGRLGDNLAPTKLTGQFSPGQMPAITLKGVSIKGQSSVQYQEAVDAAQSDAQSALNQDRVPRAYRGAVKGYFDDLK